MNNCIYIWERGRREQGENVCGGRGVYEGGVVGLGELKDRRVEWEEW